VKSEKWTKEMDFEIEAIERNNICMGVDRTTCWRKEDWGKIDL